MEFEPMQIPSIKNRLLSYAQINNCYGDSFELRDVKMPEYDFSIYNLDKLIKPAVKEMTPEEIEKKIWDILSRL